MGFRTYKSMIVGQSGLGVNWKAGEDSCGKSPWEVAEAECQLSLDGAHTLTCALMLLNTDLHGHVSESLAGGNPPKTDCLET